MESGERNKIITGTAKHTVNRLLAPVKVSALSSATGAPLRLFDRGKGCLSYHQYLVRPPFRSGECGPLTDRADNVCVSNPREEKLTDGQTARSCRSFPLGTESVCRVRVSHDLQEVSDSP